MESSVPDYLARSINEDGLQETDRSNEGFKYAYSSLQNVHPPDDALNR